MLAAVESAQKGNVTDPSLRGGQKVRRPINPDEYLFAIAEGEKNTGIYGINCQGFWPSHMFFYQSKYHLEDTGSSGNGIWFMWDSDNKTFNMDDLHWFGDTPEFKQYCLEMAEYYKRGVYPTNVISNESQLNDTFAAGTSAINFAVLSEAPAAMKQNPDLVPLFFTMDDDTLTFRQAYMRYGASFPVNSQKSERAAVALDMILNDPEINMMLVFGLEGDHYVLNDDGTYSPGPNAQNFPADTMVFMLNNNRNPMLKLDDERLAAWRDKAYANVTDQFPAAGFTYDGSKFESEIAVINSLWNEYQWSFCFGLYGDATESIVDQFCADVKAMGIDKIEQDFKEQLAAYLGM